MVCFICHFSLLLTLLVIVISLPPPCSSPLFPTMHHVRIVHLDCPCISVLLCPLSRGSCSFEFSCHHLLFPRVLFFCLQFQSNSASLPRMSTGKLHRPDMGKNPPKKAKTKRSNLDLCVFVLFCPCRLLLRGAAVSVSSSAPMADLSKASRWFRI